MNDFGANEPKNKPDTPRGNGLLYAVAFTLLAMFSRAFIALVDSLLPFLFSDEFLALASKNIMWSVTALFDLARYLFYIVFIPYLGVLALKKRSGFPKLAVVLFAAHVPISLLAYAGAFAAPGKIAADSAQSLLFGFICSVVFALLWIPYLNKSKLVRHIFRRQAANR
ncbi:MAG TPA: DUF2569 family protein [Bacilli bacterium]